MGKNKSKSKKTSNEAKRYRNNLGDNQGSLEETYVGSNIHLNGSGEIIKSGNEDQLFGKNEKVAKMPCSLFVLDWMKENGLGILIGTIVLGGLIWLHASVVDLKEKVAVYEYRAEVLEKDISEISDDVPNKELLESEIEAIQSTLKEWNFDEVEERITQLEEDIEEIKGVLDD